MWVAHTEYHPQVLLHVVIDYNPSIDTTTAQLHATVLQIGTEEVDLDHNHTIEGTTATFTITPSEHTLGHTTGNKRKPHRHSSHEQHSDTSTYHSQCDTLHQSSSSQRSHQPIHDITADHITSLGQPTGQLRKPHIRIHPIPEDPMEIHKIRRTLESP